MELVMAVSHPCNSTIQEAKCSSEVRYKLRHFNYHIFAYGA